MTRARIFLRGGGALLVSVVYAFFPASLSAQVATDPAAASPQAAPESFPVYAIDVVGVTKLNSGEIERLVYPFTGPARTTEDLQKAREAIQNAYAAKGFTTAAVELPTQQIEKFEKGLIEIRVYEAPVGSVRIVKSASDTPANAGAPAELVDVRPGISKKIRRQVPSLESGQPLNLKTLQAELDSVNRSADRRVTPSFTPGAEPGSLDVSLKVDDKFPLHSTFELNNDNSPNTTRLRATGSARYTNLWGLGHTVSASFVLAPQRRSDSAVVSGSYAAPLAGTPWTFLVLGYTSNSNIAAVGGTNVLGNGWQVGARAIYRLPTEGSIQSVSFGFDYKDFKQDIFVGTVNASSTPIKYLPVTVDYNLSLFDDESGFAKSFGISSFDASIGGTFGLRALKRSICSNGSPPAQCTVVDQFRDRDIDSFENFFHLNASFDYSVTTKDDVVGAVRWQGQLSDAHLVTNEQFGAGGVSSVRGYYQTEVTGDDGFVTAIELQLPSLTRAFADKVDGKPIYGAPAFGFLDEFRIFGFLDTGYVHVKRVLPGSRSSFHLMSVGGGARLRLLDKFTGELVVGVPLLTSETSERYDLRTVFVLRGEF